MPLKKKAACLVGMLCLVGFLGAPIPAHARIDFTDILNAPVTFLDRLESALWQMLDELDLRDQVVDMVVVGSFAYGIARLEDDPQPSDLDIILYMRSVHREPTEYMEGYRTFIHTAIRYNEIVKKEIDSQLSIDIKPDTRSLAEHIQDPDWSGYSIIQRREFNRPAGKPRFLHGYFHNDIYYVFERAAYDAFVQDLRQRPRPTHLQLEGCEIVFYEKEPWEQGKKIELLRSHPKQGR